MRVVESKYKTYRIQTVETTGNRWKSVIWKRHRLSGSGWRWLADTNSYKVPGTAFTKAIEYIDGLADNA